MISGARPIYGKLIQPKFSFVQTRVMSQSSILEFWMSFPYLPRSHRIGWFRFMETSSNQNSVLFKLGVWARLIPGKLIQASILETWMTFPEIGLTHAPENWNFRKFSGWVFQDLPIRAGPKFLGPVGFSSSRFWNI